MGNWSLITYYCAITMILIAYVLGSIPSAVWIGKKYYGVDIREHGSKNAGTTNMLRVLGRRAAVPVFVLDFFKGFVAITGIYPQIVFLCFAVWVLVFMISHYVSLASITAGCCFPLFVIVYSSAEWSRYNDVSFAFIVFSFVVAGLLIWSHRKNIERLKAGTESKIYIWHKQDSDPKE